MDWNHVKLLQYVICDTANNIFRTIYGFHPKNDKSEIYLHFQKNHEKS